MTKTSPSSVIGTRVPPETKARFAALAARHQLSESGLLAKMVNEVLRSNSAGSRDSNADGVAADRVTLRLRNGDRRLAAERARAREMKTGSYLAMLIHNHVRRSAVLPPKELEQLRVTCAQLAVLGRQLRMFGMPNTLPGPGASDLGEAIASVRQEVEVAREATAAVVHRNLISWETGAGSRHA